MICMRLSRWFAIMARGPDSYCSHLYICRRSLLKLVGTNRHFRLREVCQMHFCSSTCVSGSRS